MTVADTGIGMSESVRQRIFEPFFSTKGEAGSGLGLSICRQIVHDLNAEALEQAAARRQRSERRVVGER